jgi:DnaJ-class molecular chaperone
MGGGRNAVGSSSANCLPHPIHQSRVREGGSMTVNILREGRATSTLECAFCRGAGVDPFDLLSDRSVCQVCGGKGKVTVRGPFRECAYCDGTGIHLHRRLVCTVCGGKGVVELKGAAVTCPDCNGKGRIFGQYLPCLTCGGRGVVSGHC